MDYDGTTSTTSTEQEQPWKHRRLGSEDLLPLFYESQKPEGEVLTQEPLLVAHGVVSTPDQIGHAPVSGFAPNGMAMSSAEEIFVGLDDDKCPSNWLVPPPIATASDLEPPTPISGTGNSPGKSDKWTPALKSPHAPAPSTPSPTLSVPTKAHRRGPSPSPTRSSRSPSFPQSPSPAMAKPGSIRRASPSHENMAKPGPTRPASPSHENPSPSGNLLTARANLLAQRVSTSSHERAPWQRSAARGSPSPIRSPPIRDVATSARGGASPTRSGQFRASLDGRGTSPVRGSKVAGAGGRRLSGDGGRRLSKSVDKVHGMFSPEISMEPPPNLRTTLHDRSVSGPGTPGRAECNSSSARTLRYHEVTEVGSKSHTFLALPLPVEGPLSRTNSWSESSARWSLKHAQGIGGHGPTHSPYNSTSDFRDLERSSAAEVAEVLRLCHGPNQLSGALLSSAGGSGSKDPPIATRNSAKLSRGRERNGRLGSQLIAGQLHAPDCDQSRCRGCHPAFATDSQSVSGGGELDVLVHVQSDVDSWSDGSDGATDDDGCTSPNWYSRRGRTCRPDRMRGQHTRAHRSRSKDVRRSAEDALLRAADVLRAERASAVDSTARHTGTDKQSAGNPSSGGMELSKTVEDASISRAVEVNGEAVGLTRLGESPGGGGHVADGDSSVDEGRMYGEVVERVKAQICGWKQDDSTVEDMFLRGLPLNDVLKDRMWNHWDGIVEVERKGESKGQVEGMADGLPAVERGLGVGSTEVRKSDEDEERGGEEEGGSRVMGVPAPARVLAGQTGLGSYGGTNGGDWGKVENSGVVPSHAVRKNLSVSSRSSLHRSVLTGDSFDWEEMSITGDGTVSEISTASTMMSTAATCALEETTKTILLCSSIVHDLVYASASRAQEEELLRTKRTLQENASELRHTKQRDAETQGSNEKVSTRMEISKTSDNGIDKGRNKKGSLEKVGGSDIATKIPNPGDARDIKANSRTGTTGGSKPGCRCTIS